MDNLAGFMVAHAHGIGVYEWQKARAVRRRSGTVVIYLPAEIKRVEASFSVEGRRFKVHRERTWIEAYPC